MTQEIESLSEKISKLAEITRQLRHENTGLRLQLIDARAENNKLKERMRLSCIQIENLISTLPVNIKENT